MMTVESVPNRITATIGSGCLSTMVGFPLETLRIRLLLGNQIGELSTFNRGLTFSLSLSVVKGGCIWPIQDLMRKKLNEKQITGFAGNVISGGISNILPNLLLSPFNVTKVHLMRDHNSKSLCAVSYNIYRLHGFRGFYHGLGTTTLRDFVWGTVYFPAFYHSRNFLHSYVANPTTVDAISSFASAFLSTTLTSSIDAVRLHKINQDRVACRKFLELVAEALAPTRTNILATALGVTRVSIGTAVGHTAFFAILRYLES